MRITSLRKGDVYKRLNESSYNADDQLVFGVVTDVLNNGDQSAISAIEFAPLYASVEQKLRVFAGGKDIALFPAEPKEVETYLKDAVERSAAEVESKYRAAVEADEKHAQIVALATGTLAAELATPQYLNDPPLSEGEIRSA
jgi:hypothetical protein